MNEEEMTTEQAIDLVRQVCEQFKGTLADHQNIQAALIVIRRACQLETEAEAEKPE